MSIAMSTVSLPIFRHCLGVLSALFDKAEADVLARRIEPAAFLGSRLYQDMHPLVAQLQFSCDFAKGAVARLAGIENPPFADTETNFSELRERIDRTIAFIASVDPETIHGAEVRPISLKFDLAASGQDYLVGFAIPSFLFHVITAYALLRHNGVDIGKLDFIGGVPGMSGFPAIREG